MKTKIFRMIIVGIFLMSSMPICAQKYICLQNDIDAVAMSSDRHLKLYKNSTLQIADTLKVRIVSMTDAAKIRQKNIDGGLIEGAVFDVISNDNDLSKVHYKDKANADRDNVTGVTISVNFLTEVDGVKYLIPYSEKAEVCSLKSPMTDLYAIVFKYDEANSSLVYMPTATDQLPDGAKLVIDETKPISSIKENEPIEVRKDANIRLILSSEGSYFLDELFNTSNLNKTAVDNPDNPENDNTLFFIVGGVIALLLILCFFYLFMKSKKNKDNTTKESEDGFDDTSQFVSRPSNKDKKKQGNDSKVASSPNNITPDLKYIIQQFERIQVSLNQMTPVITKISATISDGKEVEKLNQEIERQKSIVSQKESLITEKETTIGQKNAEIVKFRDQIKDLNDEKKKLLRQLEEANKLDKDTLTIVGGKIFAQKMKELLAVCRKGEDIIKQFIMLLPEKDNLIMSFFMAKYIKEMPSKVRDQWNGVASTLSIKDFINDIEITRYLKSESDQIGWLKKHFIEDLLQSYISPLVIMLDQIRCSKQYSLSTPAPSNVGKAISDIIEECKNLGVTVKYKPLFETITTDDKEQLIDEIRSDLPKEIEDFVSAQANVPLYIEHIGVVADGVKDDKTICIVKL